MFQPLFFSFQRGLPIILQSVATECGLACLAMISCYHGHIIDLPAIRRRASISLKGMTLEDITRIADSMSFTSRAVRLELDELPDLKLPCIVHWDFNHFIVVKSIKAGKVTIHNPATGQRVVTLSEFSQHFTGIAVELWPTEQFEKTQETEKLKLWSLFSRVHGLKTALIQIFTLSFCIEVFAILMPIGSQIIIDQSIVASDFSLLTLVSIGVFSLLLLETLLKAVRSWTALATSSNLKLQWASSLFSHLLALPLAYFEKRYIGDVVSRFSSVAQIQSVLTTNFINAILDGIMTLGLLIFMFLYGGSLTLIAVFTSLSYLLFRLFIYPLYRAANEELIVYNARENTHFMESVRGIASVKVFGLQGRRRGTWLNLFVEAMNANIRMQRLNIIYEIFNSILFGLDRIVIMWLGALAVINGHMTIGMLIAFMAYKDQFSNRTSSLISAFIQFRMLTLYGERLADIALEKPECDAPISLPSPAILSKSAFLELRAVEYSYGDGEKNVLDKISLVVEPGENLAITGASGCGKSTLLKIMAGLITPTNGQLLWDRRNITTRELHNYRQELACVLQEDRLFAGSIFENISAFDPHIDRDWIVECAKRAAIHDEICGMPMRYETLVGDMGSSFSGGQKQRLFLARALYSKPKILFLDEATSHLDEANESLINASISDLAISRIIVAHRPSTIASADRIFSLS